MKAGAAVIAVVVAVLGMPALAAAELVDITAVSVPDAMVGGNEHVLEYSFRNPQDTDAAFLARLRITENTGTLPVGAGHFSVQASYLGFDLTCSESEPGLFECLSGSAEAQAPPGISTLLFSVTPQATIAFSSYNFTLALLSDEAVAEVTVDNVETVADTPVELDASPADTTLQVVTASDVSGGTLTVKKYLNAPGTPSAGVPSLGKFVEITAGPELADSIVSARIRVHYTDSGVAAAGIDEGTLRLYFFNETAGEWERFDPPRGGVDTANNFVFADSPHFSVWGVFGSLLIALATSEPTGSGGTGCVPAYALSSPASATAEPGDSLTVRLTFAATGTCSGSAYITAEVPAGWQATDASTGAVLPGQSTDVDIVLMLPADAVTSLVTFSARVPGKAVTSTTTINVGTQAPSEGPLPREETLPEELPAGAPGTVSPVTAITGLVTANPGVAGGIAVVGLGLVYLAWRRIRRTGKRAH